MRVGLGTGAAGAATCRLTRALAARALRRSDSTTFDAPRPAGHRWKIWHGRLGLSVVGSLQVKSTASITPFRFGAVSEADAQPYWMIKGLPRWHDARAEKIARRKIPPCAAASGVVYANLIQPGTTISSSCRVGSRKSSSAHCRSRGVFFDRRGSTARLARHRPGGARGSRTGSDGISTGRTTAIR